MRKEVEAEMFMHIVSYDIFVCLKSGVCYL